MLKSSAFADMLPAGQAALITKHQNMRYLSGFTGEGALFVSGAVKAVITDFRYIEQAQKQSPGFDILMTGGEATVYSLAADCLKRAGLSALGLETSEISHDSFLQFQSKLEGVEILSCPVDMTKLRAIKSADEISHIREAARITDSAYEYLLTIAKPGVTELQIVALLYQFFLDNGSTGFSFSPIIASGKNSSLPHAVAGGRAIRQGDMVTFDIGCVVEGYCSDFTRTIAVGGIDPEMKRVYDIVLQANIAALGGVRPGVKCRDVDSIARDYIAGFGYGDKFGHSLGHGVGLEIHENPRLSQKSEDMLEPGMIITIEPGIYLPGKGGVRTEDLVLVTASGCEILSKSCKDLRVL